ncbi:thioredoxin family protein [Psychroserpens ponticola]|uniref:Thioredoxin family protein n=1 Tax=Psychroserpens ponticola TaxID=2932268 RepID=A0ABY7S2P8_9FLAO|nr:thioredoxin family protein [Psychroserpens ponticola]WCO03275.1 thioredoxin family protein [Psychroserpens ponticola]
MKTLSISTIFFFISFISLAQDWVTDFEKAKLIAKQDNKTIILVFQGSDWCAPCIKLDKEIWSTKEFQTYAKEHFVMLQADFPKRKKNALTEAQQKHNNNLAEQFNKNGYFPYVVILDSDGNKLGVTGYKKTTPSAYIKILESFSK